jgi:hypothetical protein
MLEPAFGILLRDGIERAPYGFEKRLFGSGFGLPQAVLYLGEGSLYGVEVRGVGWQEREVCALCFN